MIAAPGQKRPKPQGGSGPSKKWRDWKTIYFLLIVETLFKTDIHALSDCYIMYIFGGKLLTFFFDSLFRNLLVNK
jgi:hypothetical protein